MPSPLDLDATALSLAIARREVSCAELMQSTLQAIDRLNPQFNAIVSLRRPAELMQEAHAKDALLQRGQRQGWLHGFPFAVKDTSHVQGLRTSYGSVLTPQEPAQNDSIHVARIRAAGAIVIGKTNTPEFALGSHTFNDVFGTTRNAWCPALTAGGSSGGAAVALALRMLPVADGSDLMGSLRNPAAFNNVIGLRPSRGRVPDATDGDLFLRQMATNGPMARTVEDAARLLCVQAGFDARVPLSLTDALPIADELRLEADVRGRRIGWLGPIWADVPFDPGVLALSEQAMDIFRQLGCEVEPACLTVPRHENWTAWMRLRQVHVAGLLGPYAADPATRHQLKPEALWEVEQARTLTVQQLYEASRYRSNVYRAFLRLYEHYDFLAAPSAQVHPFACSLRWPASVGGMACDTYHRWMEVATPFSLAGVPTLNLRAGFNANGAPLGIQLAGRPNADLELLRLGHAYDTSCPWSSMNPPAATLPSPSLAG